MNPPICFSFLTFLLFLPVAIDCTATLPLINSLNHLAYLTSTSPRIREMVTLDGGLERLIRILRTVPKTPSPHARAISIKEMQAIWKWSLAFQCVVNIGVRGSEHVRTRVVEAGMVPVTIRVLESYLRGVELIKSERRREAAELSRMEQSASVSSRTENGSSHSSQRSNATARLASNAIANGHSEDSRAVNGSTETSVTLTRQPDAGSNPMQIVSGDQANSRLPSRNPTDARLMGLMTETRPTTPMEADPGAPVLVDMDGHSSSGDFINSRSSDMTAVDSSEGRGPLPMMNHLESMPIAPEQVDIDGASLHSAVSPSTMGSEDLALVDSREPQHTSHSRATTSSGLLTSTNTSSAEDLRSHSGEASGSGSDGADDADMFADDADESECDASAQPEDVVDMTEDAEDRRTPRPTRRTLAPLSDNDPPLPHWTTLAQNGPAAPVMTQRQDTVVPSRNHDQHSSQNPLLTPRMTTTSSNQRERRHQDPVQALGGHRTAERSHSSQDTVRPSAPAASRQTAPTPSSSIDMIYREEEVLLSLQLLAYLSKYAHVRTLFHSSDITHMSIVGPLDSLNESLNVSSKTPSWDPSQPPKRNVFSIAEKFTLRPSKSSGSNHPVPRLATEIQYWAGVIMRNACRKDELRGGIRQCANMLCGRWEAFPREFAKCRRCRKAKYCSKQCQSKGWQLGHRFWCSSRNDDAETKEKEKELGNTTLPTHGTVEQGPTAAEPSRPPQQQLQPDSADASIAGSATATDDEEQVMHAEVASHEAHRALTQPRLRHSHHHHHHHHLQGQQQQHNQVQTNGLQHHHHHHQLHHHHLRLDAQDENLPHNANAHVHPVQRTSSQLLSRVGASSSQLVSGILGSGEGSVNQAQGLGTSRGPTELREPHAHHHHHHHHHRHHHHHHHHHPQSQQQQMIPGSQGFPSTLNHAHLRDRRVSSLASVDTADGSDLSDDDIESRLMATRGMHPAIAAAAAAAAAAGARRDGADPVAIVAPQRTDLAGRPLPPPMIASQDAGEDELALGGRATPGAAAAEQDFGNGGFDQMLAHWDPSRATGVSPVGLQHRLATIRAEIPSPDRSSSPDIPSSSGAASRSDGRSDDELAAPRARYYPAGFGQPPHRPSPLRSHAQASHLQRASQQPRAVSGFVSAPANGVPPFASSPAGPSLAHAVRIASGPAPFSAEPERLANAGRGRGAGDSAGDVEMSDDALSEFARSISQMLVGADRRAQANEYGEGTVETLIDDGDVVMDM